jgi:hypothetical protein
MQLSQFDQELRLRVGHLFIESAAAEVERDRLREVVKIQAEEMAKLRAMIEALTPAPPEPDKTIEPD